MKVITKIAHAIYREFFQHYRLKISLEKVDNFNMFAKNIECGYTLEPSHRGGSNEYPQSMFWNKNKKNRYTPVISSFAI